MLAVCASAVKLPPSHTLELAAIDQVLNPRDASLR
jgi:hypothetical protein